MLPLRNENRQLRLGNETLERATVFAAAESQMKLDGLLGAESCRPRGPSGPAACSRPPGSAIRQARGRSAVGPTNLALSLLPASPPSTSPRGTMGPRRMRAQLLLSASPGTSPVAGSCAGPGARGTLQEALAQDDRRPRRGRSDQERHPAPLRALSRADLRYVDITYTAAWGGLRLPGHGDRPGQRQDARPGAARAHADRPPRGCSPDGLRPTTARRGLTRGCPRIGTSPRRPRASSPPQAQAHRRRAWPAREGLRRGRPEPVRSRLRQCGASELLVRRTARSRSSTLGPPCHLAFRFARRGHFGAPNDTSLSLKRGRSTPDPRLSQAATLPRRAQPSADRALDELPE